MQYQIRWRNRHKTLIVTVGIGRYTQQGAARQAAIWSWHGLVSEAAERGADDKLLRGLCDGLHILEQESNEKIESALRFLGINADPADCDTCEDGSVWYGLTQVLAPSQCNGNNRVLGFSI